MPVQPLSENNKKVLKMTILLEAGNKSIICKMREGKGKREVMSQIY